MTGTQTGPLNGLPPTEARIKLPGIDVISVGDKGLLSVEGYFDQRTLIEQLGAQVAVQPTSVGPLTFGTSVRFRSSDTSVPGALAMTWIEVRSEAEAEDVRQRSRAIAAEMARVPGFLGWVGIVIAERLYTLTLWDDPETLGQLRADAQHKAAVRQMLQTDFGAAWHTGSLGASSPQSARSAVSELRNRHLCRSSRPVLPVRRILPGTARLHLGRLVG
jgi:hypothetical protein